MAAATPHGSTPYYFVPVPSRFPVVTSIGLFFVILGAGQWVNGHGWGKYSLMLGLAVWLVTLFQWFSQTVSEDHAGLISERITNSYRWSMAWFIFSSDDNGLVYISMVSECGLNFTEFNTKASEFDLIVNAPDKFNVAIWKISC